MALNQIKPLKNNINHYKSANYKYKNCDEMVNFSDEIFV